MNFPLYIAKKISSDASDKQRVSRPAIRIATVGVAIGLAVMIISVCIILGFKHTIRDKVIGFVGQIEVADFLTLQSNGNYPVVLNDSMMNVLKHIPGVKHVERFAVKEGILKTDSDFLGVAFKGVGPEWDSTFIHQNMVAGSIPKFSDQSSKNHILVSKLMADKLHLNVGQRIFAYFIDHNGVRIRRFTIQGIYETNLKKYDEVTCYTDLYTAVKLNGWDSDQASGAAITVNDFNKINETEAYFTNKVNRTVDRFGETYSSATIQDINPQIFAWLDLLDLNVWVILGLMTAVAVVTMIIDHHPRADQYDRCVEGFGSKEQDHQAYFPVVCSLHCRQGTVDRGRHRYRPSGYTEIHRTNQARPTDLLCQYGPYRVQLGTYRGSQRCDNAHQHGDASHTKLSDLPYSSCPKYAV